MFTAEHSVQIDTMSISGGVKPQGITGHDTVHVSELIMSITELKKYKVITRKVKLITNLQS